MLFEIQEMNSGYRIASGRFVRESAGQVGLLEKDIEHWLAEHPELLLPNEQVLVIGQSVSGQSMADILALDSFGRLIIVEVKRHRSGRDTVAQLLGYAARMREISYEALNAIAQRYWNSTDELYARFQDFAEGQSVARDELGKRHRVIIVAPEADTDLREIVSWLASYGVPVEMVPFTIYADSTGKPRLFHIDGVLTSPEARPDDDAWMGDWIFNTNETYAPGAYERMFQMGVAAIVNYANGPRNLEGTKAGDLVFAYVNRQGLRAIGTVRDGEVYAGSEIFFDENGQPRREEYHLAIDWQVVPEVRALSAREAGELGYPLPVRSVFAKLQKGQQVRKLEAALRQRLQQ